MLVGNFSGRLALHSRKLLITDQQGSTLKPQLMVPVKMHSVDWKLHMYQLQYQMCLRLPLPEVCAYNSVKACQTIHLKPA